MKSISEFYVSRFGEPARQAEFISPSGHKIEVYKWDERHTDEGVAMYATIGANEVLGDSGTGCEFFVGLTPEVDDIVQTLAEVALHGRGDKSVPASGDSITLSYPLWSGTEANALLFTDGDEILPSISVDGRTIIFLQLVPLFTTELAYKKKYGERGLWSAFEAKQVPYWDSRRAQAL